MERQTHEHEEALRERILENSVAVYKNKEEVDLALQ